jgi:hypothetical protein
LGPAEKRSSSQLIKEYRALSRQQGTIASQHSDVDAALAGAERVIEAEFVFPYLAHAPMEPLDRFVRGKEPRPWRTDQHALRQPKRLALRQVFDHFFQLMVSACCVCPRRYAVPEFANIEAPPHFTGRGFLFDGLLRCLFAFLLGIDARTQLPLRRRALML